MTLEEAKTLAEFYNQCKILSEETRQKLISDLFKNQFQGSLTKKQPKMAK